VEEGLDAVLSRKPRATPAVAKIFDGAAEARVIALACSQPPVGHARWSLRLLESKVVELGIIRIGRAAVDYAHALKDLADTHFPVAAKIVLVQDNLNTHCPASLYEAFPAAEARHIVERFEWHYTPKHGSWLISPNPNSACWPPNVSTDAFPTSKPSSTKSKPGRKRAIPQSRSQLALHSNRRPHQAQNPIPLRLKESRH